MKSQSKNYYDGKTALVTGGSSGIGFAIAKELFDAGAKVIIVARNLERLQKSIQVIRDSTTSDSGSIDYIQADITSPDNIRDLCEHELLDSGRLDLIFNNAGIAQPGTVESLDFNAYQEAMEVNFFGTVSLIHAFLPKLIEQGSGTIINISSILGFMGLYAQGAYAASKHALSGFSESIRQELEPLGVKVIIAFPGDTDTPQYRREIELLPPEAKEISSQLAPRTAEQVAKIITNSVIKGRKRIYFSLKESVFCSFAGAFPNLLGFWVDRQIAKTRSRKEKGS
jgi:3-dehydrosphinganine reductase